MKYKTEEGELIEGNSPVELVESLRDGSRFASHETVDEYMAGFARRYLMYAGVTLRTDSCDVFIDDLKQCGYLTTV